ncbi:MAG: hypothetical protein ACI4S9_09345 [Christensenellales bacterium]
MKKNVLVFFGGNSAEHDISVITALGTMAVLEDKYNVIPIYVRDGVWYSGNELKTVDVYKNFSAKNLSEVTLIRRELFVRKKAKYKLFLTAEAAVLCTHGGDGENGCLQGLLEMNGLPYTGSGVEASAVCMNKITFKNILRGRFIRNSLNFSAVDSLSFDEEAADSLIEKLGLPLVVKPASLGSSIGVKMVYNTEELKQAVKEAGCFDSRVLVEKGLSDFSEYNCAAATIDGELTVSCIERPFSKNEILTFEDKYVGADKGAAMRELPAKVDPSLATLIRNTTMRLYREFGLRGVARVDYLYDNVGGKLYVNEINTIPGSLSYYLFENCGIGYAKLLDSLIGEATADCGAGEKKRIELLTYVLNSPKMLAK